MGMKPLDTKEACGILNEIMEYELAGVVRYTHSAMMVTGPYRIPIVAFLKEQAAESLLHAQGAGELIAGLDGCCSIPIFIAFLARLNWAKSI